MAVSWNTSIQYLSGVGEKRAKLYEKLDIYTLGDLLAHYPRRYLDYSSPILLKDAISGEIATVSATITEILPSLRVKGGRTIYRATAFDALNQKLQIVYFNNPYALRYSKIGETYLFQGKISGTSRIREMISPTFIHSEDPQKLRPIYSQTHGLTSHQIAKDLLTAYHLLKESIPETLPDDFRLSHNLCRKEYAIYSIHFPSNYFECEVARKRLAFEELLTFQLSLHSLRSEEVRNSSMVLEKNHELFSEVPLPFSLTKAQRRVLLECLKDLESGKVMNRLVQGDVGSGKTIISLLLAFMMARSGWQSAIMSPTEILAQQHFQNFTKLLSPIGISTVLITGSLTAKERREADQKILEGSAQIAIGTHALISEKRLFHNLGLVVTDEQHRFGVRQRSLLAEKGNQPHTLVMSATPIPRTLALILYGDLEVSTIDELPPGRKPIQTYFITGSKRTRALNFVRKHLDEGKQAYIVCPLVEESEDSLNTLKSVEQYSEELRQSSLKGYTVGLLHGKMKASKKAEIMRDFANGIIQVLVSTTVIEVGVDVPNAVIMMVENAERFGLSQLHQLRGRVGRGASESFCILVSDAKNEETLERLKILTKTQDGFRLAEEDLRLRGPGDFLGKRQHGVPLFKAADFFGDTSLFKEVNQITKELISTGRIKNDSFKMLRLEVKNTIKNMEQTTMN